MCGRITSMKDSEEGLNLHLCQLKQWDTMMRTFLAILLLMFVTISGAFAQNPIVIENQLPGTPASQWDLNGLASTTLEGFATDISVNHGSTVNFKIKSNTASWKI